MVQVDKAHGTNTLDSVIGTQDGNIITLESLAPFPHPLNAWTGGHVLKRGNNHAHGYSASQGIFVHSVSRGADIFGVYVPVTFEIFDNRPNVAPEHRKYVVEVRDGPSWKRVLHREEYSAPGIYTVRVYVRYGPGCYTLTTTMHTSHIGIIYKDMLNIGYNVKFMDDFDVLLWLPLLLASATIVLCGTKKTNWEDDDEDDQGRDVGSLGILGRALIPR